MQYLSNCVQLVEDTRRVFFTGRSRDIKWREQQLRAIARLIKENKNDIYDALYKDMHKVFIIFSVVI